MEIILTILWIVFILSFLGILWMYVGYPFFLTIVSKIFRKEHHYDDSYTPMVTMMILTHNEAKTIEAKIKNTLELDYPKHKLEIFVVDDGSTDATQEIVKRYVPDGIKLILQETRKGKASAISYGLKYASNDTIIITDANAIVNKNAVRKIVRHFADPMVGAACGRFVTKPMNESDMGRGESIFWRIEKIIRTKETDLDSVIVLSGALTAIRRGIVTIISEDNLAEDFDYTLEIRKEGYRVVYEPDAIMWKLSPSNVKDMVTQKKRQTIGTLQTLIRHRMMLFNPKYGWYGALILPSHKLLPTLSPFLFTLLFASSCLLYLLTQFHLMLFLFYLELFVLIFSVASTMVLNVKPKVKFIPFISSKYFLVLHMIVLLGWWDYLRGNYQVTWKKIESSRQPEIIKD